MKNLLKSELREFFRDFFVARSESLPRADLVWDRGKMENKR